MFKKLGLITLSLVSLSVVPAHASGETGCSVQVAVSTPPVLPDQNVAFNVTNGFGFSKSITLRGGNGPQNIEGISCSSDPLTISATLYTTPADNLQSPAIGQCTLKAGSILLSGPENSVSVVFPYDFICTN
jgi:hypothetical protein